MDNWMGWSQEKQIDSLKATVSRYLSEIAHLRTKLSLEECKQQEALRIKAENKKLSEQVDQLQVGRMNQEPLLVTTLNAFWGILHPHDPNGWAYQKEPYAMIKYELEERADRIKQLENLRRLDAEYHVRALENLRERIAARYCRFCADGKEPSPEGFHPVGEEALPCHGRHALRVPLEETIPGEGVERGEAG